MRTLLFTFALFGLTCVNAAVLTVENFSGHPWTNATWAVSFPVGRLAVPLDSTSLSVFSSLGLDGAHDATLYVDDVRGEVLVTGSPDAGSWFNYGFLSGFAWGGLAFGFRLARLIGRSSPEL